MNFTTNKVVSEQRMVILNNRMIELFGGNFSGLSYDGEGGLTCHFSNPLTESTLLNFIALHNTIALSADTQTIAADNTEVATITAPLGSFEYKIWQGREVIGQGNNPDATLGFKTNTTGTYLVEVIDDSATGYIEIEAV